MIVPPSPNWFLSSCLEASSDGWLVYGTLDDDVAVLEPEPRDRLVFGRARLARPAHRDRVTCVALGPGWTRTREFASGSEDGRVKLWNAETLVSSVAHDVHSSRKESVVGLSFLDEDRVFSVGSSGSTAVWNVRSNAARRERGALKLFRPTCLAACPRRRSVVAVGTKTGVAVVLSVSSDGVSALYKAPGHNAEITSLSWCPDPDFELPEARAPARKPKETSDFLEECRATLEKINLGKLQNGSGTEPEPAPADGEREPIFSEKSKPRSEDRIDERVSENCHYLASCCKNGLLCIWRPGGSLALSTSLNVQVKKKAARKVTHPFGAICWLRPFELIASTRESRLVVVKLAEAGGKPSFKSIHDEHKRGLFRIASDSDGAGENSKSIIWTAGMDRVLAGHDPDDGRTVVYSTFGGFVYDVQISRIDPATFAAAAGDGTIRVYKFKSGKDDGPDFRFVKQFWNGVGGKVLGLSWHPTKEKCLAFTTYEGRIGVLDVSVESPAKLFPSSLRLGAFRICWDDSDKLFACGDNTLIVFDAADLSKEPAKIDVEVCNQKWDITTVLWTEYYLCVGSSNGGFALLNSSYPHRLVAAAYPHKKRVSCIAWHPKAVFLEDDESPYSNLVAVAGNSRNVIVLKINNMEGDATIEVYVDLEIHDENITSINWSPHNNGHLVSTAKDCTVRIWDVINKCLLCTFIEHEDSALFAVWHPFSSKYILSCGTDYSLRMWNVETCTSTENQHLKKKHKKKTNLAKIRELDGNLATLQTEKEESEIINKKETTNEPCQLLEMATVSKSDRKILKKNYPLVNFRKEYVNGDIEGCRRLFNRIKLQRDNVDSEIDYSDGFDYLKIYGGYDDIMQILEIEKNHHMETYNWIALTVVGAIAGDIKQVIEYASKHRKLTPYLLCLAPSVSHRFWKDMLFSYNVQVEGENNKKSQDFSMENLGNVWRGVLLLSLGNIEEACSALSASGLEIEAICAARARHADHIAEKHLKMWSNFHISNSNYAKAAECLLSLNMVMEAANILGKSNEETELALAAEMAKYAGNSILADSISQTR